MRVVYTSEYERKKRKKRKERRTKSRVAPDRETHAI